MNPYSKEAQAKREREYEGLISTLVDDFLRATRLTRPSHDDAREWILTYRADALLHWWIVHQPQPFATVIESAERDAMAELCRRAFYDGSATLEGPKVRALMLHLVTEDYYDLDATVEEVCRVRGILGSDADLADQIDADRRERARDMQGAW